MKLIIEISQKAYKEYMNLATGRIPTYKACDIAYVLRNGTPLDEIKAEIKLHDDQKHYPYGVIGIRTVLQIIDKHIGKRSE